MSKYCCNEVARKRYKLSRAGDPYTIEMKGKKGVVGYYDGKKLFETTPEYFKDNFFPVKTRG